MNPTLKNTNLVRVKYVVRVVKALQTRTVSDNMTLQIKEVYISLFEISISSKIWKRYCSSCMVSIMQVVFARFVQSILLPVTFLTIFYLAKKVANQRKMESS